MQTRTHNLGWALLNGPNVWVKAITIGPFILIWDKKRAIIAKPVSETMKEELS